MFPLSDSHKAGGFPLVNIILIGITVFVFFQQLTAPNPDAFAYEYALVPSQIDFADWSTLWPFITSIFLHGGFLHIISNMWFLWVFGDNVEEHIGEINYFFLYILAGIGGNLLQYLLSPLSSIPMLGASGAVAGVLGAYYVLFPHSRIKTLLPLFFFVTIVEIPAGVMLGYWFILQVFSGVVSLPGLGETGGVAFFAHVSGFLIGLLAGRMLKGYDKSADAV